MLSPRMAWELKKALSPPTFVLTVVRHPFARLVSAFRFVDCEDGDCDEACSAGVLGEVSKNV